MSPWERVRAGRPTAVVGALPPAPEDLRIVRGRCGPGLAGLDAVARQLALPYDVPVRLVCEPLAHRLVRDLEPPGPAAGVLRALAELCGHAAVVLSRVERCGPDAEALLLEWIGSGEDLPLVLVADREQGPLLDALRERYGSASVLTLGAPQAPLASLPTDVLHALIAGAALGSPFDLDALARATERPVPDLLASLQSAAVRGVRLGDEGSGAFTLDPDLEEELRAATLPTLAARLKGRVQVDGAPAGDALTAARSAVALGAWEVARRLFPLAGDPGRLEHAAVCWALGEAAEAARLLDPPGTEAERQAMLGIGWGERDALEASLAWCDGSPRGTLDRASLLARHGRSAEAHGLLVQSLHRMSAPDRAIALHLLARLPLLASGPSAPERITDARRHVRAALDAGPDDAERARLLETAARLALRAGEMSAAAACYLDAIPALEASHQHLALARAVAGLAVCARATEASDPELVRVGDVLGALHRAVRINRARPHGLAWCKLALQGLMERVDVGSRSSLLSDLRRVSLEIAALQAHMRLTPRLEPL